MRIRNSNADMKELEETNTEVRRVIDLQFSIWDRLNSSIEDDGGSPVGSPGCSGYANALGNFFEDAAYAWLSCGPRLVVLNVKTGTSISSWTFRERVTCVSSFPAQRGQVPLLLVGLDNGANKIRDSAGMVCVFDCTTSQVLRAVRMPAGVEQVCVVIGGAEWEDFGDKRIEHFLVENSGLACVALRNLDHLIIDLKRSSWEGPDATPVADEANPAELDFSARNKTASTKPKSSREKHVAYNLMNRRVEQYIGFNREEFESTSLYQESLTSSIICSRKIGCLVSGCLGRIIIWQMDGAVRWVSSPMNDNMSISNLALLEPTDDPRPYCYLWASYQEETSRLPPVLRMYAVLFERKYSDKGSNAYFNLEGDPRLKFELELDEGNRITNLHPIVRESNPEQTESGNKRGEENLLLISLDSRTLLFDLNQWYKEQMPHTVGDCQNPNAFLASYRTRPDVRSIADEAIVNCSYLPSTLKEFSSHGSSPPEELFFPNSLSLEWVDLGAGRLTFWMTRGVQAELLREMSLAGPVILLEPSETFHRCLSAGLIPLGAECSFNSDKDVQRETLLSLCLEQRWLNFLLRCGREWSDGSASYLFHAFLRWGMQRVSSIKLTAHRFCTPLFDQWGSSIGEAEVKTLRFFSQQLECISNVYANLLIESVDLTKQRRSVRRLSTYLQVLLWFYDVGLLPETDKIDDEAAPLSFSLKIPYPFERLATIYREKREQFRSQCSTNIRENNEEDLFIDELLTRECPSLKLQWEREGSELSVGGNYPPPSLQSLLRSYLTACHNGYSNEVENKHQITIYLLMDLAMLLQESYPSVDQLIKYPSAFKLSPSLIKLTQALWLLDHEDYQGFLNMMTGQLVSDSDVKDWHHKLVLRTLIRNNQNKLALIYLRVRKPPLSSIEDQGVVISLTVEHGLVQSAFHRRPPSHYAQLLTRFFRACKSYGKLNDILHLALDPEEEEAFVKFLEDEKSEDTRLLYYLQRCRYAEAGNVYPPGGPSCRGNVQKSNKPASLTIFNAYNATLPDVTRKFSGNVNRRVLEVDPDSRYPRPMSHCKSRGPARELHETVIRKAKETFVRGERSQIPFMSAPCSSLRSGNGNVDTNCVMFVERARKPYGKRSLDEMRSGDDDNGSNNDNNGEERKRRKTTLGNDTPDNAEAKEVGTSMVFDTPLIKRKAQIASARNTPAETPQSILKIRQLIRDSTSPSVVGPTSTELAEMKVVDKERKPRQIRFSIGQRRAEESMEEEAPSDTENIAEKMDDEANEESDETEKSLSKCDVSAEEDEEVGVEEEEEEEESEETFFSTNVSGKSLSETTLLSDSSYASRNLSGPRPRPGLRRSNISSNESSSDLLRKSLMKASDASTRRSRTPPLSDSAKVSSDLSSQGENKGFAATRYPQSPRARPSLLSTSIYSESILSSDTSFERTSSPSYGKREARSTAEKLGSFVERTVDKFRDFSGTSGGLEKNEISSRFRRSVTAETVTRRSVAEEYTGDVEEDKNSEVLMEVDGFGLDRDSDTRPPSDRDGNWELEKIADGRESLALSTIRSDAVPEVSEMEENMGERGAEEKEEEEKEDEDEYGDKEDAVEPSERRDLGDGWPTREVSSTKKEAVENVEGTETNDGYDEELLALKYDEDDDPEETFRSLTNSMDVDRSRAKSSSDRSPRNDEAEKKPSSNNGFCDEPKLVPQEFAITDDESSSRSVEGSAPSGSTRAQIDVLEDFKSPRKLEEKIPDEASNMTDDESDLSRDSSIFSGRYRREGSKKSFEETNSRVDKIADDAEDSSLDSSIFSNRNRKKSDRDSCKENNSQADGEKMATESTSSGAGTVTSNEGKESERNEFGGEDSSVPKKGRQSARISKIGSLTPKAPAKPDVEVATVTPLRMTRSRRASSVVQESLASPVPESPAAKTKAEKAGRPRRGSSLAKDLFASDNNSSRVASTKSEDPRDAAPAKKGRLQRSTSLAKEIFATRSSPVEVSPTDEELPTRRRTRRAASVQKEIPATTMIPKPRTRSSSKASLTEETADEEQHAVATAKRTTRSKREISLSKDSEATVAVRRSTRASSLAKEIVEEREEIVEEPTTKRVTRKRGSSVPKETTLETSGRGTSQRTRRGSSVAKEIIPEESNESPDETKNISSGGKFNEGVSPTSSTRIGLTSVTAVAEDDDEMFSANLRGKAARERKKPSTSRERRAVSVDPALVDVKRRTAAASLKSAISEDPIEEENSETELSPEPKTRATRKAPVRRKRTTSGTSVKDCEDAVVAEKLPQRRTRKLSQRSNESTGSFRFSPPDLAQDRPDDDQKGADEVPDYVFSPPHTRSKYTTPNQPRRKLKDFITATEEEKKAADRPFSGIARRSRVASTGQPVKSTFWFDPRKGFIMPARSKSTTD